MNAAFRASVKLNFHWGDGGLRYTFNGKEKENEIAEGDLDFGARVYDSRLGRWMKRDAHFKRYPELSDYCYVANMPIRAIDRNGYDIIVLLDPNALQGEGHMAMLVGNDKDGWRYISNGGRDESQPGGTLAGGPALPPGMASFNTLDEFYQAQKVNPAYGRYTDYARFSSTGAQDSLAYDAAFEQASGFFRVDDSNCGDAVSAGMQAAGLDPGYSNFEFDYARGWLYGNSGLAISPVDRFNDMVVSNGSRLVSKKTTIEMQGEGILMGNIAKKALNTTNQNAASGSSNLSARAPSTNPPNSSQNAQPSTTRNASPEQPVKGSWGGYGD